MDKQEQKRLDRIAWCFMQASQEGKRLTRKAIADAVNRFKGVRPFLSLSVDEQENLMEAGLVTAFRNLAPLYGGTDYSETIRIAEALHNVQPDINGITSRKLIKQQYSTPLPLAARLGYFVRIGFGDSYVDGLSSNRNFSEGTPGWYCFEPTAGNGLLSAFIPPRNLILNEFDDGRVEMLRYLAEERKISKDGGGINKNKKGKAKIYQHDAFQDSLYSGISNLIIPPHTEWLPNAPRRRVFHTMLINPPFETIKGRVVDGCPVSKAEHLVGLNSLSLLVHNPGARAALIIGGKTNYDKYGIARSKSEGPFLRYLYSHYHVIANVTFAGNTYAKQGARFPFRVFLINGVYLKPNDHILPPTREEDEYYERPATDFSVLDPYIESTVVDMLEMNETKMNQSTFRTFRRNLLKLKDNPLFAEI